MTDEYQDRNALIADFFRLRPAALLRGQEAIAALNEQGSVAYVPSLNIYAVTGYKAVSDVARRTAEFSSRNVTGRVVSDNYPRALLNADGKEHARHKAFVSRAFAPAVVNEREPVIRALVDSVIDSFIDAGHFALVEQFALRFPVVTIASLLGVPPQDQERFVRWALAHVTPIGNPHLSKEALGELDREFREFESYFLEVIRQRRQHPQTDFISLMLAKSDDGSVPLSDAEMIIVLRQLLTGGIETTAKLITSSFEMLLNHPSALAEVANDFSLIPNMLEETLRIKAPVHGMFRTATVDTEVDGCPIPKDGMVWLVFSSGGHDAERFECPRKYDIKRPNADRHLSFGSGVHRCVGFALAKLQSRVAFEQLFRRMTHFRRAPDDTIEPFESFVIQGLKDIKLQFDRR